ncbi:Uncharacterised protein [Bordetella pertussis]|nr:Uncharacterised protein [Bordetella pertussis]
MCDSVTGVTGSVAAEVSVTGRSLTYSTPWRTVRPVTGNAGQTTAMAPSPQASRAASISALKAPRKVESTFLYRRCTPAARSLSTSPRTTAAASAAAKGRLCVVTASTSAWRTAGSASACSAPPTNSWVAQPARTNCTAVSPDPVRSSATMPMYGPPIQRLTSAGWPVRSSCGSCSTGLSSPARLRKYDASTGARMELISTHAATWAVAVAT